MRTDFAGLPALSLTAASRLRPRLLALAMLLGAAGVAGCATARPAAAERPPGASSPAPSVPATRNAALAQALGYHQSLRGMSASELARERNAQAAAGNSPLAQVRLAMLLSQPHGPVNLGRALSLLEAISTSDKPEAVALQPLARLLAEQVQERQRLENTAERLTQQLERTGQQLKDAQRQGEQLQEKLDALTEIERTLQARPASLPVPAGTDRRSDR